MITASIIQDRETLSVFAGFRYIANGRLEVLWSKTSDQDAPIPAVVFLTSDQEDRAIEDICRNTEMERRRLRSVAFQMKN